MRFFDLAPGDGDLAFWSAPSVSQPRTSPTAVTSANASVPTAVQSSVSRKTPAITGRSLCGCSLRSFEVRGARPTQPAPLRARMALMIVERATTSAVPFEHLSGRRRPRRPGVLRGRGRPGGVADREGEGAGAGADARAADPPPLRPRQRGGGAAQALAEAEGPDPSARARAGAGTGARAGRRWRRGRR